MLNLIGYLFMIYSDNHNYFYINVLLKRVLLLGFPVLSYLESFGINSDEYFLLY